MQILLNEAGRREEVPINAVVNLRGGFGNQLFQHAFGTWLSMVHGLSVAYDIDYYRRPNKIAHNRLRLIELGFDAKTISESPTSYFKAKRLKFLPGTAQFALFGTIYVKCKLTKYVPVRPTTQLTYYDGYWQCPLYFNGIDETIRRTYRRLLLAAAEQKFAVREGVVGFHVRRGDYLTHGLNANLNYATYLQGALNQLEATSGRNDWIVSVYSDDPDWCESNLSAPRIEINRGNSMLNDFLGLMTCRHKIISNSTFAWWAAFLGEQSDSVVIGPRRWHATADIEQACLLYDGWLTANDG